MVKGISMIVDYTKMPEGREMHRTPAVNINGNFCFDPMKIEVCPRCGRKGMAIRYDNGDRCYKHKTGSVTDQCYFNAPRSSVTT